MKEENLAKINQELKDLFYGDASYLTEDEEFVKLVLKQRLKHHGESVSTLDKAYQRLTSFFKKKKKNSVVFTKIDNAFEYLLNYIYPKTKPKPDHWVDAKYAHKNNRPLTDEKKLRMLSEAGFKIRYILEE